MSEAYTGLRQYDAMRVALYQCTRVDEAASIKEVAARIEAYARIRDDKAIENWAGEVKLRACQKIGEMSADMEANQGHRSDLTSSQRRDEVPTKTEELRRAGISRPTAQRYEVIAGGKDKQARQAATAVSENYFAKQRAAQQPPTMKGLRQAIRDGVDAAHGGPPKPRAVPKPDPLGDEWFDWTGAIRRLSEAEPDMEVYAAHMPIANAKLLLQAKAANAKLQRWIKALERRVGHVAA